MANKRKRRHLDEVGIYDTNIYNGGVLPPVTIYPDYGTISTMDSQGNYSVRPATREEWLRRQGVGTMTSSSRDGYGGYNEQYNPIPQTVIPQNIAPLNSVYNLFGTPIDFRTRINRRAKRTK